MGGVSKSEDGGESWAPADPSLHPDVHHLTLHPTRSSYLYAATGGGVYVGERGKGWREVAKGLKHSYVRALSLHPRRPEVFYVAPMRGPFGGDLRIYRTSDRGASWEETRRGLPEKLNTYAERKAFTADDGDPAGLYLGTGDGAVFASPDEADSWRPLAEDLPAIQCLLVVEGPVLPPR